MCEAKETYVTLNVCRAGHNSVRRLATLLLVIRPLNNEEKALMTKSSLFTKRKVCCLAVCTQQAIPFSNMVHSIQQDYQSIISSASYINMFAANTNQT